MHTSVSLEDDCHFYMSCPFLYSEKFVKSLFAKYHELLNPNYSVTLFLFPMLIGIFISNPNILYIFLFVGAYRKSVCCILWVLSGHTGMCIHGVHLCVEAIDG